METEAATHTPAAVAARGFSSVMSVLVIRDMSVFVIRDMSVFVIRDMQRERGGGGQGHICLNCSPLWP